MDRGQVRDQGVEMNDIIAMANEFKRGNDDYTGEWYEIRGAQLEAEFLGSILLLGGFALTAVQRKQLTLVLTQLLQSVVTDAMDGDLFYDNLVALIYMFANIED